MSEVDRVVEFIKTNGYHTIDEMPNPPVMSCSECDEVAERTGIKRTIILNEFYER